MRKMTHGFVVVWAVVAALQQGPVYRGGRGVTQPEMVQEVRASYTPASMER